MHSTQQHNLDSILYLIAPMSARPCARPFLSFYTLVNVTFTYSYTTTGHRCPGCNEEDSDKSSVSARPGSVAALERHPPQPIWLKYLKIPYKSPGSWGEERLVHDPCFLAYHWHFSLRSHHREKWRRGHRNKRPSSPWARFIRDSSRAKLRMEKKREKRKWSKIAGEINEPPSSSERGTRRKKKSEKSGSFWMDRTRRKYFLVKGTAGDFGCINALISQLELLKYSNVFKSSVLCFCKIYEMRKVKLSSPKL